MANLKEIKRRIGAVKKTRQITSAMKLVSGAKLSRATAAARAAGPYQKHLSGVLQRVGGAAGDSASNPLLQQRDSVAKVMIAVITSDRGLCGAFNTNVSKKALGWKLEQEASGVQVDVVVFGRKANDYLKNRGVQPVGTTLNYAKTAKMDLVRDLSELAESSFVSGDYDEVHLVFNRYVNTMTQEPTLVRVLPLSVGSDDQAEAKSGDLVEFEYEPSAKALLDSLLPLYLRTLILQAFLETEAGEHAARMTAMDSATRNASDLIEALTLEYNRARQAAITTEIIEIVSGAEALKG